MAFVLVLDLELPAEAELDEFTSSFRLSRGGTVFGGRSFFALASSRSTGSWFRGLGDRILTAPSFASSSTS